MSVFESLFVGVCGLGVVFIVLVALSLIVRLQSALVMRFTQRTPAGAPAGAAPAEPTAAPEPVTAAGVDAVIAAQPAERPQRVVNRTGTVPYQSYRGGGTVKRKFVATLNGKEYEAEVEEVGAQEPPELAEPPRSIPVPAPERKPAPVPAPVQTSAPAAPSASPAAGDDCITAPVPGTVIEIKTSAGAGVKRGQILMLIEAMKMENEIVATRDCVVAQVLTTKGASVAVGEPLITLK